MKNNIKCLLLKIRSSKWRIKVASDLYYTTQRAYLRHCHRLGWQLVDKLSMAVAYKLDAFRFENVKIEYKIERSRSPPLTRANSFGF